MKSPTDARSLAEQIVEQACAAGADAADAAYVSSRSSSVEVRNGEVEGIDRSEGEKLGLRVFIGCGDRDSHIPITRAAESARLFEDAGATVDYRRYDGMDHTINDDEIEALRDAVADLADDK